MEPILQVRDVSIEVGHRLLMKNVSFDVNPGDAILLSGENGIGKSTLLKAILGIESEGKKISGSIIHKQFGDIMKLDANDIQQYRSQIAYIPQRDDYSEMGTVQVKDIISENGQPHSGKLLSASDVNDLIDTWIPRRIDGRRVFDAKGRPAKFSGGEQRLLTVLSIIASRFDSDLIIIDEPLNNLDYVNARTISNMINRVIRENPKAGVLMISHCRIFPFITREIKLSQKGVIELAEHYVCHSCFGEANELGFYE